MHTRIHVPIPRAVRLDQVAHPILEAVIILDQRVLLRRPVHMKVLGNLLQVALDELWVRRLDAQILRNTRIDIVVGVVGSGLRELLPILGSELIAHNEEFFDIRAGSHPYERVHGFRDSWITLSAMLWLGLDPESMNREGFLGTYVMDSIS